VFYTNKKKTTTLFADIQV